MRKLLNIAILSTLAIAAMDRWPTVPSHIAFNHPASATDLKNFYRSIRALSADPSIDGSAIAIV